MPGITQKKFLEIVATKCFSYVATFLLLFFSSNILKAEEIETLDMVAFKLYVERDYLGMVNVLVGDEQYFVDFAQLLKVLGYPFEHNTEIKSLTTCCPNVKNCIEIKNNYIVTPDDGFLYPNERMFWDIDGQVYLDMGLLNKLTDFELKVFLNSLSMYLITSSQLPVITLKRIDNLRNNFFNKKAPQPYPLVDTIPLRNFWLRSVGYSLNTIAGQGVIVDSVTKNYDWTGSIGVNAELLRGSLFVKYTYSSVVPVLNHMLTFQWHNPMIDKKIIKQLVIQRQQTSLISSQSFLKTGVYISNQKSNEILDRKYLLKGTVLPNTEVEIYSGFNLLAYVTSDSIGNYEVEIPILTGKNRIKAVTYDSYGNAVKQEKIVYRSSDLEPRNRLWYYALSGVSDDKEFYVKEMLSYGLTDYLTIEGGSELLLSNKRNLFLPIMSVKSTLSHLANFNVTYIPNLQLYFRSGLNITDFVNLRYEYESFKRGQTVVPTSMLERTTVGLSTFIPIKRSRALISANIHKFVHPKNITYTSYAIFTCMIDKYRFGVSVQSSTPDHLSFDNRSYTLRLGYLFNNHLSTDFYAHFMSLTNDVWFSNKTTYIYEQKLRCFLDVDYFSNRGRADIRLGVTWNLPSVSIHSQVGYSNYYAMAGLGVSGSITFSENQDASMYHKFSPGASLYVVCFVDENNNKVYDKGEKIVNDIKYIIHTPHEVLYSNKGIQFRGISSYSPFRLYIPEQALVDISWQITPFDEHILLLPSQTRTVYVPIEVLSEVLGQVSTVDKQVRVDLRRLRIVITNVDTNEKIYVRVDEWGQYNHMGLTCGTYTVQLAPDLLAKSKLQVIKPEKVLYKFTITPSKEGEEIADLDFLVGPL